MSHVPLSTWRCCMSSKNPQISRLHTLKMVAHTHYIVYSASSYNHITNEKCVWLCWFKTYFSVINVSLSSVPPRATFPNHHHHREANCDCTRRPSTQNFWSENFRQVTPLLFGFLALKKNSITTKNDLFFSLEKHNFFWPSPTLLFWTLVIMTWQQKRF